MNNKLVGIENNIVFNRDENNNIKIEVRLQDEDAWLNVKTISNLFNVDRSKIVRHINIMYLKMIENIYLPWIRCIKKFRKE